MRLLAVLGAVAAAAIVGVLLVYNRLVRLRNRVHAARADLEVQLARRYDLIPNLVETVRAYAAHERDALEAVTAARAEGLAAVTTQQEAAADERASGALGRVLALAEAYPALKADERFRALTDELVATENKLAFSRQLYNDTVKALRDAIQSVPGVWLARPLGFAVPAFFTADPSERGAVDVRREE